jgi:pyridoxamine 5'-phosphate oxidase
MEAIKNKQKAVEAFAVSSLLMDKTEVDSRFINIKIVDGSDFIFFSNYSSLKATHFLSHNQVALLTYWKNIDTQIRIKGIIDKTPAYYSDDFFKNRSKEKNFLAISSCQSKEIESYQLVLDKYKYAVKNNDPTVRPKYWGGYSITPYYFEFWSGNDSRINKREVYEHIKNKWRSHFLEP